MNRNQFSLLLFLVVVLGMAGLLVYNKQNDVGKSGDPAIGKKLLPNLPVNDVAHVALKQGTNQVDLAKKDGTWRVGERNDYPANYSEISDFLIKAAALELLQIERLGPSQPTHPQLTPYQAPNPSPRVAFLHHTDPPPP